MAKPERPFSDDDVQGIFGDLTSGWNIGLSVTDLPTLPRDGVAVPVNLIAGADFRDDVFRTFGSYAPVSSKAFTPAVIQGLAARMDNLLSSPREGIHIGGAVAIDGSGLVLVEEAPRPGEFDFHILGASTLFGRLQGVSYGDYPFLAPELLESIAEDDDPDTGGDMDELLPDDELIAVEQLTGLVAVLESVVVCDAAGYGQKLEDYTRALVPLPVSTINFYQAYLPDESVA